MAGGISAQGSILAIQTGTTQVPVWTKISGIISYNGLDGSASDIDVTDLDSVAMEYISGLVDNGKFSMEAKTIVADPGQMALRAALVAGKRTSLRLTFPDAVAVTFDILVKSMPISGGVNAVLKGTIDTKVTGKLVWTP